MKITYQALGKVGRLGNQLWQVAAVIGLARERGNGIMLDPDWIYRPYFSLPDEFFEPAAKDEEIVDATWLVDHMDYRAKAYLQEYGLIADAADEIRQYFTPSTKAWPLIDDVEIPSVQTVAVHVRRGDNLDPDHEGFYIVTPEIYYRSALALVGAGVLPIFFSDGIEWCRETFADLKDAIFIEPNVLSIPSEGTGGERVTPPTDWRDMQLMARCDNHILGNSTYSWWGAFLACDTEAIWPECWFGPKIDWSPPAGMMPPGWISLPCF